MSGDFTPGAPCWIDLMTPDPVRAAEFYTQLFGWAAEEPNPQFGGYFNFTRNGARVAGAMPSEMGPGVTTWSVYLNSPDARQTVNSGVSHGGHILGPAMEVGDLGTMAVLGDPGGAGIGVWQSGAHPGFAGLGEPGGPGWFELHTREYDASVRFYQDVFGWNTAVVGDTDEFRYTVLRRGEDMLAGILDASNFRPAEAGSAWVVYFAVDDTDAAVTLATSLGGEVLDPARDTPYGRMATLADPTGAQFKLSGPNVESAEAAG